MRIRTRSRAAATWTRVKKLTRTDLEAFRNRWIRPDNATLLVVGDATPDSIKPLLEKYLAAWKAPADPLPKKNLATVSAQPKPRVFLDQSHGRGADR